MLRTEHAGHSAVSRYQKYSKFDNKIIFSFTLSSRHCQENIIHWLI